MLFWAIVCIYNLYSSGTGSRPDTDCRVKMSSPPMFTKLNLKTAREMLKFGPQACKSDPLN